MIETNEGWWKEVGGGWSRWVIDIKEGTCDDEHWVLYVSDKSLNSAPETNTALYVNWLEFKYRWMNEWMNEWVNEWNKMKWHDWNQSTNRFI